jgi:hypothetical protein
MPLEIKGNQRKKSGGVAIIASRDGSEYAGTANLHEP